MLHTNVLDLGNYKKRMYMDNHDEFQRVTSGKSFLALVGKDDLAQRYLNPITDCLNIELT